MLKIAKTFTKENLMKDQLDIFKLVEYNDKPDEKKPTDIKLKPGQLWCPYCSNKVMFIKDKKSGVKKCPICGISIKEYWVKKVNGLS